MREYQGMIDLENNQKSIHIASKDDSKIITESNMPDFPCTNGL